MKKKNILAFLLALVMMLGCMTGCQPGGQTSTNPEQTEKTTEEKTPAQSTEGESSTEAVDEPLYPLVKDGEEVTLKGVIFTGGSTSENTERYTWQKLEEITGINVEFELIDEAAMNTYLASNDWPDFFLAYLNDTLLYDYGVIGGRFVNLLDYIELMPNLAQTFEEFPAAKNGFILSNGEMYKFPRIEVAVTSVAVRQYWRTDLLEDYGLKTPTTVDEFKQTLATLKEKTGKIQWTPNFGKAAVKNCWNPGMFAAFGEYVEMTFEAEDDGKVTFIRSTDQMRRYYEYMNDLYENELIHQECFSIDKKLAQSLEKEGNMLVLDRAASSMTAEMFKDGKWSYLSCSAPLTSQWDSTQVIKTGAPVSETRGPYLNANSEHVELMCKVFDIMYATEEVVEGSGLSGMSFTYGLEGEHWAIAEDGKSYEQIIPEGYEGTWTNLQSEKLIIGGNLGRATGLSRIVTSTPGNAQARQQSFVDYVWPYVADEAFPEAYLSFTEDEQRVIEQKWTEIETYIYEMEAKFITGVVDIETGWDTYLKTLDQMGLQDVMKVYQAAYDRWCEY